MSHPSQNPSTLRSSQGFTLIELLIVIGILAVLATVTLLVINPAQMVKQSRDANRVTEINQINQALLFFQSFGGSSTAMGTHNTVYVSIPSSTSDCSGLGLPALGGGYVYHCSDSAHYRNIDGTGWIPVDLTSVQSSAGNLFFALPIDPINTVAGGLYYTYIPGSWALSATMESDKYLASNAANDGGQSATRFELGNEIALDSNLTAPVCGNNIKETGEVCDGTDLNSQTCATQLGAGYTGTLSCNVNCQSFVTSACTYQIPTSGLVGYWKFDEGSGTTAYDSSGNGNNGVISNPVWSSGKLGGALSFGDVGNFVKVLNSQSLNPSKLTISVWVYPRSTRTYPGIIDKDGYYAGSQGYSLTLYSTTSALCFETWLPYWAILSNSILPLNTWNYVVATFDGNNIEKIYINGVLDSTGNSSSGISPTADGILGIGARVNDTGETGAYNDRFDGKIDEVAIYNRALSSTEIQAVYNGQK